MISVAIEHKTEHIKHTFRLSACVQWSLQCSVFVTVLKHFHCFTYCTFSYLF